MGKLSAHSMFILKVTYLCFLSIINFGQYWLYVPAGAELTEWRITGEKPTGEVGFLLWSELVTQAVMRNFQSNYSMLLP